MGSVYPFNQLFIAGGSGTLIGTLAHFVGDGLAANAIGNRWRCVLVEREECNQDLIAYRIGHWQVLPDPWKETGRPSVNDLVYPLARVWGKPKFEVMFLITTEDQ